MNNRKTFSRMRTGLVPRRFRPGIFLGRAASSRRYVARYRIEAIAMRLLARWRSAGGAIGSFVFWKVEAWDRRP